MPPKYYNAALPGHFELLEDLQVRKLPPGFAAKSFVL